MIIPVPVATGYGQDSGISRADTMRIPLVIPKPPAFVPGYNSVNRPLIQQSYQFPGSQFNPAFIPLAQLPVINTIAATSEVIQAGSVNRLSSTSLQIYLKSLSGQGV